jgi:hypothetical protein
MQKRIIQRNLPLTQVYILLATNYVALEDSFGTCCDNCGKLIANMATVKGMQDNKAYTIGLDCLETFLLNNQLLEGKSIEQFQTVKKALPKVVSIRKEVKDFLNRNPFIDSVVIEDTWGYVTLNYFQQGKQRWNDGYKYKTMDFELLLLSLQSANKNVTFTLN